MASNQNVTQLLQQSVTDPTSLFYAVTGGNTDTGLPLSVLSSYLIKAYPGFLQSGVGAIARPVQTKLQESVSPEDFGAVGDGVTNDRAAFQEACNTGLPVYLSPKTYVISGAVNITKSGTSIRGSGRVQCHIYQLLNNTPLFNVTANGVSISGVTLDYSLTPISGATAITCTGNSFSFFDFDINSCDIGIDVSTSISGFISKFNLYNYVTAGIHVHGNTGDIYIEQFVINAITATNGAFGGIYLTGACPTTIVRDGDILLGKYSLVTANEGASIPTFCRFDNVFFDSATNGSLLQNLNSSHFQGCWFSGGRTGTGNPGCQVGTTEMIKFRGCDFVNCGSHGCLISVNAVDTHFIDCNASGNSIQTANTFSGLFFDVNSSKFSIIGGAAKNIALYSGTQKYGITVQTGATNFLIQGIDTNGNATGDILNLSGTGSIMMYSGINNIPIGNTTPNTGKFTTLQTTGAYSPSSTAGIVGTITNDNANAGSIGEFTSVNVAVGSAVALTTNTAANVASLSLTAGDWEVWGNVWTNPAGTTVQSNSVACVSLVSATIPTTPGSGALTQIPATLTTGTAIGIPTGTLRVSIASTTTVYLVALSAFSTSTNAAYGYIAARRRR